MEMISKPLLSASLLLLITCLLSRLLSASRRNNADVEHYRRIPSPPAFPVVGHLHLLKKPLHRSLAALAKRYASDAGILLLRFGSKPVLLVTSAAVAGECFTIHDVALADRPGLASRRLLTEDFPSISTANYGALWRQLRRLATVHALCAHRLAATTPARDAGARAMAARLRRRAGAAGSPVAVKAAAYEFVVAVIMAMVAGEGMTEEQVRRLKEMTEAGFAAAGAANRQDFLPAALRVMDFGRTAKRLAGIATARHQFGQSLQQEGSPEPIDDVVIRTVCLSLLQAGTDTSSSTIEWAMALLLKNPDVLKKATSEIHTIVGTSHLIKESDLTALPYLRCIITETLRLKPLTPNHVPHEASRDCMIAGYTVARGTMVLVDVYSMQRDPNMWEDPEKFMPERFMDVNVEGDGRFMMPFGMGRRKCPGEGLALRTVGMALGVMIQCFEWECAGEEVNLSEGSGLTMPMAVPLVALCKPRAETESLLKTLW
ncbi:unnamed protein product [Urochloa decumbens]|uniref:Cytochrome P450 n=1 Tax=Urochloa decumbens TaxID=240449 RepID=A0ABC8VXA3_9POAL